MESNQPDIIFDSDSRLADIPEGLLFLVKGYSEYAKEVVVDRAIPKIDGFKPSQRRILYTMEHIEKVKDLSKSQSIAGSVLKIHPHGDAAVYLTMVRMVDKSEYMQTPFIHGKGGFGKVFSTDAPSASRYTDVSLAPLARELFGGFDGIKMVPSYNNKYMEPELLPVSFPNILTNTNAGIAVGMASNIPSFNFHEVNQAVIDLIETGDLQHQLAPDFTTKGFYVSDPKELQKIIDTGHGRIKLRGKWHVDNKTIIIDEIPYYTTTEAIMASIKEVPGIADVRESTDKNGLGISIECSNKRLVNQVLTDVLRVSQLQMTITTNIVVIIDNKPRVLGVKELLEEWIKFRSSVLAVNIKSSMASLEASIARYTILKQLLDHEDHKNLFLDALTKQGDVKARDLLVQWFPDADPEIFTWILDLKLRRFSRTVSQSTLDDFRNQKVALESDLTDPRRVIVRELKDLNSRFSFPRRTVITDEDYAFDKSDNVVVKAEPVQTVVLIEDKFVKKVRFNRVTENLDGIRCMSDDVISFIDNHGRLLRLDLDKIDFVSERDRGLYLPVYLEVPDDFNIVAYELIANKKVGYVYSDGFVSVVDYGEWAESKRTTRITQNGVSPLAGLIVGELDMSKNYLILLTRSGKFGFAPTDFKNKHRTARTKLVNVKKGDEIVSAHSLTYQDIMKLVASPEKYMGKLSLLTDGDTFNSEYMAELIRS